ncbi:MAG: aspartate aminotransferase family protein [Proteobacteria bacterium]|nr:aspartate aminotransferase family protein [Pseudomonadota bacterium]MCH8997719.1 aspartate aminotransferase family protein [Pseudomonadota bacterium]
MVERPNSAAAMDIASHLHPYTNARRHETEGPMVIVEGKGIYVYDDQGKEYIEGLAGLWSTALGFSEERLVQAAAAQMRKLPYYHSFAHKAPMPTIELAAKLIEIAPVPMSKVFFANSGSEANDTVIKMVWYYNNALGRPDKKKIISRIKGYHGVTVATASLTGLPFNQRDFDLPIANILHTSCPHHYRFGRDGESEEDFATRCAAELEQLILDQGPETIAAFIGEPVMGAGGVIVPPRTYWAKIQAVLEKYDVLLIDDEVICGFGRTGNLFGCQTYGIKPDIITVAKALSSSYLPISAVLISDQVYQTIADNSAKIGTFGHGYTYSGHPVPAAVALETLKIYEERDIVGHVRQVGPRLQAGLRRYADHPMVGEVRGVGLIAAVELVADRAGKVSFDPPGRVGGYFAERAQAHGLIIRNLMDTIAFCPPLIITEDQIDSLVERFARALDDTASWVENEGLASVA